MITGRHIDDSGRRRLCVELPIDEDLRIRRVAQERHRSTAGQQGDVALQNLVLDELDLFLIVAVVLVLDRQRMFARGQLGAERRRGAEHVAIQLHFRSRRIGPHLQNRTPFSEGGTLHGIHRLIDQRASAADRIHILSRGLQREVTDTHAEQQHRHEGAPDGVLR